MKKVHPVALGDLKQFSFHLVYLFLEFHVITQFRLFSDNLILIDNCEERIKEL